MEVEARRPGVGSLWRHTLAIWYNHCRQRLPSPWGSRPVDSAMPRRAGQAPRRQRTQARPQNPGRSRWQCNGDGSLSRLQLLPVENCHSRKTPDRFSAAVVAKDLSPRRQPWGRNDCECKAAAAAKEPWPRGYMPNRTGASRSITVERESNFLSPLPGLCLARYRFTHGCAVGLVLSPLPRLDGSSTHLPIAPLPDSSGVPTACRGPFTVNSPHLSTRRPC